MATKVGFMSYKTRRSVAEMGMFDCVDYKWVCPLCGMLNETCQSKSAKDGIRMLRELKPQDVNDFYDYCEDCSKKEISVKMTINIQDLGEER